MASTKELRAKLDEVNGQIETTRSAASEKWTAFEQARNEFASAGNEANRTDSDEFKKAEEVHREYATKASELANLEAVRDGIFAMLSSDGSTPDPASGGNGSTPDLTGQLAAAAEGLKPLGVRAVESEGYAELKASGALNSESRGFTAHLAEASRDEIKAMLLGGGPQAALLTGASDTSAGAFVKNDVKPYVPQPRRPLRIVDLITVGDTDSDTVEYVRQSAWTNVAAETAEATATTTGTKPEATIAWAKVLEAVKTIAHWVPATRRSLADAGQLRTMIESQLRYGLDLRLEDQIVNGNGTGENLTGILNTSGILTQAKGADLPVVAIHKAITQLRLGFIEPNGVGLHPTDWELVRLTRDDSGGAGTGQFMYGPPALAGTQQVWGLPVAVTAAIPDDTGLVGAFNFATLWLREAAQILASDSHDDFFVKNLVAVLAELRAAFGVLLPAAFCKVTGLD